MALCNGAANNADNSTFPLLKLIGPHDHVKMILKDFHLIILLIIPAKLVTYIHFPEPVSCSFSLKSCWI